MFAQCSVLIALLVLAVASATDDPSLQRYRGHVLKKNGRYEIVSALASAYNEPDHSVDNVLATGFWDQTYNITGWSVLEIKTLDNQTNFDQAYSAGLLEGQLTRGLWAKFRSLFDEASNVLE